MRLVVGSQILDPSRPGVLDNGLDAGYVRVREAEKSDPVRHVKGDAGETRAEGGGGREGVGIGIGLGFIRI